MSEANVERDLFCKIVAKEIPANIVYEDDNVLAFRDIAPQAPVHVLIVPKKHISKLSDADDSDALLMGKIVIAASRIARQEGIEESGYRLIANVGQDGGQEVFHVHFHVLGGRDLGRMLQKD
ncbi:MAG: histidine triad nucleotide-binding protein [Rubrobacteridae bacterium]|nr:histidine triad nucleotide-binding protein [Rubrobacteridae bacterium]